MILWEGGKQTHYAGEFTSQREAITTTTVNKCRSIPSPERKKLHRYHTAVFQNLFLKIQPRCTPEEVDKKGDEILYNTWYFWSLLPSRNSCTTDSPRSKTFTCPSAQSPIFVGLRSLRGFCGCARGGGTYIICTLRLACFVLGGASVDTGSIEKTFIAALGDLQRYRYLQGKGGFGKTMAPKTKQKQRYN